MVVDSIIWIVIFLVIAFVIYKVTKSILKVLFLMLTILSIIIAVFGFLVISDAMELKENFQTKESTFLLEDNSNIIAGISTKLGKEETTPEFLPSEKLGPYSKENLTYLLGDNYKLFIFKKSAFNSTEQINTGEITLTKSELFDLINSETPIEDFIVKQAGDVPQSQIPTLKQNLMQQMNISSVSDFRGILFASLLSSAIQKQGSIFIFDEYQQDNVMIYPQTILFRFIKKVPMSLLQNFVTKSKEAS